MRDLARTNSKQIRGPKWLWTPIIGAVNTLGWVGYFLIGKKR
ncbi:PLDc N-terminal domain-containing protein [Corynebacterium haemomassiliense]|nr:PLDc N-terminal domain-containing protein [Corynebacterium haemomassiliense]